MDFETSRKKVDALTHPRNVVLVGASDRPGAWAARVWRNIHDYKFPGPVYPFNPSREELYGQKCYGDFSALPEKPDHLVVLAPAAHVAAALRAGAAAGARSATVFSSGFGEAYEDAALPLGAELRQVIEETGLGVSGPNCMGNFCGPSSFVTLTEERQLTATGGPIAMVGQSGGVMIFLNAALEERHLKAGYLITSGNEAGLQVADYIAYFAHQDEVKVILVYIEGIKDVARFSAACRHARSRGKEIVAIKLGQSEDGRGAARAHTNSVAGSIEAFDALANDLGVIRAPTLDDAVEICELLVHTGVPKGARLGAITLSGAFRGILFDAAQRNGAQFLPLQQETFDNLNTILNVGSLVSNPVDGGFGVLTSESNYLRSIEALDADPNIDMILMQEALPREMGSGRGTKYVKIVEDYAATKATKPIAFVTLTSHGQSDYSRQLRKELPHVSFLQEANKAIRAIVAAVNAREMEKIGIAAAKETLQPGAAAQKAVEKLRALAAGSKGETVLDRAATLNFLRESGISASEAPGDGAGVVISITRDPEIGPVVSLRSAGMTPAALSDRISAVLPVSRDKARAMLASTTAGQSLPHQEALMDAIVALAAMARDISGFASSFELGPLGVAASGQGMAAGSASAKLGVNE